jgi:hypothetical protein
MSVSTLNPPKKTGAGRCVRLSVNLATDVAGALRGLVRSHGISVTEGIRRAIAIWKFVEDEQAKGNRIAVIGDRNGKTSVQEIILTV